METSFNEAAERKEPKYHDLVTSAERAGYNTTLITLEMGSHRVPHQPGVTYSHKLATSPKRPFKTPTPDQPSSHHWFIPNIVHQEQN